MKLKLIAASVAALGCASAFAAPLNPVTATVAPANYIYIAGASAQSQALNAVAKSLFDVPADVVQITAAAPCGDTANIQKHVAYLGVRGGVNTMIVYRNNGGSGAGLLQLLAKTTAAPQIVTSGSVINLPGSAVAGSTGAWTATSTNCAAKLPAIALQDVRPAEHTDSVVALAGTANYDALTVLQPTLGTGLQGFGIAVSNSLYTALQTAQGTAGQPSVRKADYASLIASTGSIKSAVDFINDPTVDHSADTIEVARRVDTSGTQASSNIYFLAGKTSGKTAPLTAAELPLVDIATNLMAVTEGAATGDVKTRLNTAGYVVGVMSLENKPSGTDTWKWVAIDGVSPDYHLDLATGTVVADPYLRQSLADTSYDFGYESFVAYRSSALGGTTGLATVLANEMKKTSLSNLVGYCYLDAPGTWAKWDSSLGYTGNVNKQCRGGRAGNNLSPLMY